VKTKQKNDKYAIYPAKFLIILNVGIYDCINVNAETSTYKNYKRFCL